MSPPRRRRPGAVTTVRWLARVVRHRMWAQSRLLAVAGAVAALVSVLVCSLAVVVDTTEDRGVATTLAAEPDRARVTVTLSTLEVPVPDAVAALDDALVELLGARAQLDVQVTSVMYDVERPGQGPGFAYLDRRDGIADNAVLVAGEWPGAWSGDPGEPVPVAVPALGAQMLGWELGGTTTLAERTGDDVVVRVVGLYEVPVPTSAHWARDRLGGRGYEPTFPVPFGGGFQTTEAVGPLVVAPATADEGAFKVRRVIVRADPDLSDVGAQALPALRASAGDLDGEIGFLLDGVVGDVSAGGDLSRLLREAATGVVVARAGVAVATALLLVLAAAALLQTARLVAEARSAEHDLVLARGASRRQLLAMVALESVPLGLAAAVVGPVLSPWVVRTLGGPLADGLPSAFTASVRALPATAWGAGLAVAGLVVAVMIVPLVRAPATFVEGQQHRGRADRRGSLGRLTAEVALVAVAAITWTQLRAYGGPLSGAGAQLAVDPVLAVGPALLLVTGGVLGIRVLPLAGKGIEKAAARGRGLVVPLAGWDIGRRPQHAATAVLLLAIALASATFGLVQGATWRTSQLDQAAFSVGAPVVVADAGSPSSDAHALQAAGLMPQPVARVDGTVTLHPDRPSLAGPSSTGQNVDVLAAPSAARDTLDRGRLGREGGAELAALPAPAPTTGGIDLGRDLLGLSLDVTITGGALPDGPGVALRAVLEDASGLMSTVELGTFALVAGTRTTQVLLPDVRRPVTGGLQESADALADHAAGRAYPVRLVAVEAVTVAFDARDSSFGTTPYDAQVTLENLAALRPAADVDAVDPDAWASGSRVDGRSLGVVVAPVEVPREQWTPTGDGLGAKPLTPVDHPLWLRLAGIVENLGEGPAAGALVAWEPVEVVPTVVSSALSERLGADAQSYQLEVDDVALTVGVAGVVGHVPTVGDGFAVAIDQTALARALVEGGASATLLDEWWVDAPDAGAYLAGLPADADGRPRADRATTIEGEARGLLEHPLRSATPVTLLLLAIGGALVAAVGFAVHTAVTVRGRALELAQLRAVGLTRGRLTAVLGLEAAALAALGVVLGVGVGGAVTSLIGRLLVVGADGAPPLPATVLVIPDNLAWVAAGLVAGVAALTAGVSAAQRAADPAALLRAGESR